MRKINRQAQCCAYIAVAWIVILPLLGTANAADRSRPVLDEFIQSTLNDHPALVVAQAELNAARARAKGQNRPLYNPELELDYENTDVKTRQVGLAQSFDWTGKRGARYGVAQAQVSVAEANYEVRRKTLLTELLIGLSVYQASLQEFQLSTRKVELNKEFLRLAKRRSSAGDITQSELLTARLALAEARAARSAAENDLSLALEQLVALSGDNRSLWPNLDGVPIERAPSLETVSPRDLPELNLANQLTQVSRSQIRVAQKDRNPDPTLGVRYGKEGPETLVGVSFSIPIPVLNNYRAEVDEAKAGLVGSEQSYLDTYRRVEARLVTSHERLLASLEGWMIWQEEGALLLNEQRQLLQKLWEYGEINAIDYLVQLEQTFATESAAITQHSRLWIDWFIWLEASNTVNEWTENLQ